MPDQLRCAVDACPALPIVEHARQIQCRPSVADHCLVAAARRLGIDTQLPTVQRIKERRRVTSSSDLRLPEVQRARSGRNADAYFGDSGQEILVDEYLHAGVGPRCGRVPAEQRGKRIRAHHRDQRRVDRSAIDRTTGSPRAATAARTTRAAGSTGPARSTSTASTAAAAGASGAALTTIGAGLLVDGAVAVVVETVGTDLAERIGRAGTHAADQAVADLIADEAADPVADAHAHATDCPELGVCRAVVVGVAPTAAVASTATAARATGPARSPVGETDEAGPVAVTGPVACRTPGKGAGIAVVRVGVAVVLPTGAAGASVAAVAGAARTTGSRRAAGPARAVDVHAYEPGSVSRAGPHSGRALRCLAGQAVVGVVVTSVGAVSARATTTR